MPMRLPVFLFFVVGILALGCGGGDDDKTDKTPATCAATCAQQNRLCGTKDDCDTQCSAVAQVVSKTGCNVEFQQSLDCLSEKNVCDEDETACPATSFYACVDASCANSADPLCVRWREARE